MLRTALLTLVSTVSIAACGEEADSSLTIENASSYSFIEINLSPDDQVLWGSDLLGTDTLDPGDKLIVEVSCDTYDIRVIDDETTECVLNSIDLCFDNAIWQIDNTELVTCGFQL